MSQVKHIRHLLQTTTKGNLLIQEYIQKVKEDSDVLSTSTNEIFNSKLILYVISGLGFEFDAIVINLTYLVSRGGSLSLEKVQFELQAFENQFPKQNTLFIANIFKVLVQHNMQH